ncbi:circadian clock-controlled protein daywake-like [Maniola jurtina]|uniref:circadian clock-controlled protein daywake-like n=1 Tax=Maniola jurtina TaxID=191418 RepID=UPI001E68EC22|nr:circadian clock-controlled protein daywake-like [Maniola jurtina]
MKTGKEFIIFIHVVLFLILAQNLSAINPLTHEKCHLEDSFCLTKQAQKTLRAFLQGIPELGIKSFEKMHLDYIEVKKNKLHYQMWNTIVEGFNNTIFDDISMDFKVLRISFHSNLVCNCDYKCDGEVYRFPVIGDGKSEIKMNNLQVEIVISFEVIKNEQGKDIMNLKSFFYGADALDGVHHYFGNMFNGNEALSVPAHKLMNATWRTLVANYGRFFTIKIVEEIFKAIKIFMRSWPLEDLAIYTDTVEVKNNKYN